jgi:hypothetical protein
MVTSLLGALARIKNHIKAGDPDGVPATIARAHVAAHDKVRDADARARPRAADRSSPIPRIGAGS